MLEFNTHPDRQGKIAHPNSRNIKEEQPAPAFFETGNQIDTDTEYDEQYSEEEQEGLYDVQIDFLKRYSDINPDDVRNLDIDENNKVSINYKNGSSEVYTINNADKLVLKSGIYKYENGCKIKRYARDGKTLLEESRLDEKNEKAEVIRYSKNGLAAEVKRYNLTGARGGVIFDMLLSAQKYRGAADEELVYNKDGSIKLRIAREITGTGAVKSVKQYDEKGVLLNEENDFELDEKTSSAFQGYAEDCWLLAAIDSIARTEKGQQILKENITFPSSKDSEKKFTVRLPGAERAIESLKTWLPEDKIFIKGSYEVSQEELDGANTFGFYSSGDQNVLLYELAFEQYKRDVNRTLEANNIERMTSINAAGLTGYNYEKNPLAFGVSYDAQFILTGRHPSVCINENAGEYGIKFDNSAHKIEITPVNRSKEKREREETVSRLNKKKHSSVSAYMKTAEIYSGAEDCGRFIKMIIDSSNKGKNSGISAAASVYITDGKTVVSHALSIVNAEKDTISFIDPADKSLGGNRIYKMPLEDFKKCINRLDVLQLD